MAKWLHQRKGLLEGEIVWTSKDKVWTDIKLSREHDITNASGRTYTWPAGEIIRCRTTFITQSFIDRPPRKEIVRSTHCGHGHEFTPENTYTKPTGQRVCRACVRAASKASYRKRKAGTPS